MDAQMIYKQLWNYDCNEILARRILDDYTVPSGLRAIAHYLLRDYRGFRELYGKYSNENPEDIFWSEVRLMLAYLDQSRPLEDMKEEAESLTSREASLVFSRLLLAGILARRKEYQRSIHLYETVLSISPENLSAMVGLMGVSILTKRTENARGILRKAMGVVSGITNVKRRIYWQTTLLIYGMRIFLERSLLIGVSMFIMGFFPQPLSWILLVISLSVFLSLALFFLRKKNSWAFSILTRLIFSSLISWLIGLGTKLLFFALEGF